jgi:sporulation-control protein spo0M
MSATWSATNVATKANSNSLFFGNFFTTSIYVRTKEAAQKIRAASLVLSIYLLRSRTVYNGLPNRILDHPALLAALNL